MKNIKSIALLSLSLILASCGAPDSQGTVTPSQNSEGNTSTTTESESTNNSEAQSSSAAASSSVEGADAKIKKLLTKMGTTNNCTIGLSSGRSIYVLGDKALMVRYADSEVESGDPEGFGLAVIENVGTVRFDYINSTAGLANHEVTYPTDKITVADLTYTCKDLAEAVPENFELIKMRSGLWYTESAEFAMTLAAMDGVSSSDLAAYGSATAALGIDDNGTTISATYSLTNPTDTDHKAVNATITIGTIGTTTNLAISNYLKSNPTFSPAAAWDTDSLTYINAALPNVSLPLPTGRTYCYEFGDGTNTNGVVYADYGCGNITNAYKTQIASLGFTLDTEESDATQNFYVYKKLLTPASGLKGAVYGVIEFYFQASSDSYKTLYPYGMFVIMVGQVTEAASVSASAVDTEIAKVKTSTNIRVYPTFNPTGSTKIEAQDLTDDYDEYMQAYGDYYTQYFASLGYDIVVTMGCSIALTVDVYFPTQTAAEAFITSYKALLSNQGFTAYTSTDSTTGAITVDESYYTVSIGDTSHAVEFEYLDEDTNAYLGYVSVTFMTTTQSISGSDADLLG